MSSPAPRHEPRAILMPTCSRHARFADLSAQSLHALWPRHPPLWILTDGGGFQYPDVIRCERSDWVGLVHDGLRQLLAQGAIAPTDWVLVILEDHAPMEAVMGDLIDASVRFAEQRGAAYVKLDAFHGSVLRIEGQVLGRQVAVMDPDWRWYNSLQPAAWRVEHLLAVLAQASGLGALDPWSFEQIPWLGRLHLAVDSVWPSAHGGFLKRGRVDASVVFDMRHPASRALRRVLLRTWLPEMTRRRLASLVQRLWRGARVR